MDGLTDIINSGNITEVGLPVLFTILMAWMFSKNSDKQQEQQMLHNEQTDKLYQIIANFSENLTELVSLIREGNEKTDSVSDKIDELNRKIENLTNLYNNTQIQRKDDKTEGRKDGD